ncbi:uncharacterized protein EI90DRAFT_3080805, partial [Cantharellus anzutake]|uniref:uncharacterized protein n=1 Tax=Cantharellus anzutake TaxID=1750568 RepID=UPI0019054DF5
MGLRIVTLGLLEAQGITHDPFTTDGFHHKGRGPVGNGNKFDGHAAADARPTTTPNTGGVSIYASSTPHLTSEMHSRQFCRHNPPRVSSMVLKMSS